MAKSNRPSRTPASKRRYHLKSRYGITPELFDAVLVAQGGVCAICERDLFDDHFTCVDHDHSCCPGKQTCGACVRGLLCRVCNVWLRSLEDKKWFAKAKDYLER